MGKKIAVIIPVHKPSVSQNEKTSLLQCKKVLSKYDVYLVYPQEMDIAAYQKLYPEILLQPVAALWLASLKTYNAMKCNKNFYTLFQAYDFMLTYELDAYIFSDDWYKVGCFEYDYIGAPWLEGFLEATEDANFIKGGNSGFSMRNIQSCLHVLQSMKKYKIHWLLYKHIMSKFPAIGFHINRITKKKYEVFIKGQTGFFFSDVHINEDIIWSQVVPRLFPYFKVAEPQIAARFSFEANPAKLLILNNNELPLGCHAWLKFQSFWKDYIDIKRY